MITSQDKSVFLLSALFIAIVVVLSEGAEHLSPAKTFEKTVTLNVNNEPLSSALNKISNSTGYRFIFDPKWSDTPVSATLTDLPIEKGLKRLLKNFDHAIVFESDRTIRIVIYGKTGASAGSTMGMPFSPPPPEPAEPDMGTDQPPFQTGSAGSKLPPKPETAQGEGVDQAQNESGGATGQENNPASEEKAPDETPAKTE